MTDMMHPGTPCTTRIRGRRAAAGFVLSVALLGGACSKGSSIVSDKSDAKPPQTVAQASPTPASSLSPSVVPTMPVGPIGQTTPTAQGAAQETREIRGNMPVTVSQAKPALTPAPDPFPARPTPTVVMAEGKIVQQWPAPAEAAKLTSPVKGKPDAAKIGHEFYMQKCVDCHGKEGKGNGWMGAALKRDGKVLPPTNLASKMVQANTDGELFWKITNGRSPMPAHRVRFDDEQRWYIVAYLRTLKE